MNVQFFISSGGTTTTTYPDSKLKVFSVSDVKIGAEIEGSPAKKYSGNLFIIQLMEESFFHMMNDMFGQYETIKRFVPDLKIVCIFSSGEHYKNLKTTRPTTAEILEEYSDVLEEPMVLTDNYYARFENVFYLNNAFTPCLAVNTLIQPSNPGLDDFDEYQSASIKNIANKFKKYRQPGLPTKKIFITRKKENDKLRHFRDILNKTVNNKPLLSEEELFMTTYGQFRGLRTNEAITRYIDKEDEAKIENYFFENGYEIIDPGTLTYKEQVFLYSSATHVAGLAGAGMYNTIHCHPSAKVFIINTGDGYNFWHSYFAKSATDNVYETPKAVPSLKRYFDAKYIISTIEESNEYSI